MSAESEAAAAQLFTSLSTEQPRTPAPTANVNQFAAGTVCGVAGTQYYLVNTNNQSTYMVVIREVANTGVNTNSRILTITNGPANRYYLGCSSPGGFPPTSVDWFFVSEVRV